MVVASKEEKKEYTTKEEGRQNVHYINGNLTTNAKIKQWVIDLVSQ